MFDWETCTGHEQPQQTAAMINELTCFKTPIKILKYQCHNGTKTDSCDYHMSARADVIFAIADPVNVIICDIWK